MTARNREARKPLRSRKQVDKKASAKKPSLPLTPSRKPVKVDTVVDHYRFGPVVGNGGFSLVYRGTDIRSGSTVIIKEFFPKQAAKRSSNGNVNALPGKSTHLFNEGLRQFFSEARTLCAITHPHIVKASSIFRANNTAYMVSEGVTGKDLKWFLNTTRRPLNTALLIKIFMPILSGLRNLHQAGFLHLDIKPANILLRSNGSSQLLDFGASQPVNSTDRFNSLQTLTHGFAPPEQYDKRTILGPWTDLYAIAATMYYCMTYRVPKKSKGGRQQSQLNVSKHSKHYPETLVRAINQSLQLIQAKRFFEVDDFANAILAGSEWKSLEEYETKILKVDRHRSDGELTDSLVYGKKESAA